MTSNATSDQKRRCLSSTVQYHVFDFGELLLLKSLQFVQIVPFLEEGQALLHHLVQSRCQRRLLLQRPTHQLPVLAPHVLPWFNITSRGLPSPRRPSSPATPAGKGQTTALRVGGEVTVCAWRGLHLVLLVQSQRHPFRHFGSAGQVRVILIL